MNVDERQTASEEKGPLLVGGEDEILDGLLQSLDVLWLLGGLRFAEKAVERWY